MGSTLIGLMLLASAATYPFLLLGAAFVGIGSAIFHPESSRVARFASGGRYGLAQSVFQVAAISARRSVRCLRPSSSFRVGRKRGLVRGRCRHRYDHPVARQPLVCGLSRKCPPCVRCHRPLCRSRRTASSRHSASSPSGLHQEHLHGELLELLHLLRDRALQRGCADGQDPALRVPGWWCGGRHRARRADRRQVRSQDGDLVLDPRRPAVTLALPYVGLEATVVLSAIIGLVLASAFRQSSSSPRNWFLAGSASSQASSSASPSAWA